MRDYFYGMVLSLPVVLAAESAHACRMPAALDLHDIKYASVVVVGRISNYEIVLDQAARRRRQELLARSPNMSPDLRKTLSEQKVFLSDYARFEVLVDEVLVGQPPKTLSVTWNNSTFGEPDEMGAGPFLIGLREPSSKSPPLRGPSATVLPSKEPKALTVLQAPCAPPFILKRTSAEAKAVREMLSKTPE